MTDTQPIRLMGWQPMESCPKDGSKFLAKRGNDVELVSVHYWDAFNMKTNQWEKDIGLLPSGSDINTFSEWKAV